MCDPFTHATSCSWPSPGRATPRVPVILTSPPLLLFISAESDFAHDAFCLSECRKEKDEREYYCYSEFGKSTSGVLTWWWIFLIDSLSRFSTIGTWRSLVPSSAINGVVHDIEVLRKGVRLITLMVSSDGFYKMSRLYVSPDNFFFKVQLLVLDTYKCSKPCPDIKLGKWNIKKKLKS